MAGVLAMSFFACTTHAQPGAPEYHVTRMGDMLKAMYPGNMFLSSDMRGLNEDGDAVGEVHLDSGDQFTWIYSVEHGIVALPVIPGFRRAAVTDISDRDANGEVMIVGYGGFSPQFTSTAALWRFSTVTGQVLETRDIGIFPGYDDTFAVGVNNAGSVIGYATRIVGSTPQSTPVRFRRVASACSGGRAGSRQAAPRASRGRTRRSCAAASWRGRWAGRRSR